MDRIKLNNQTRISISRIALALILSFVPLLNLHSKLHIIRNSDAYHLIKQIEIAATNDTILIDGGSYKIDALNLNKPISIIGQNSPILRATAKSKDLIFVTADNVRLENLILSDVPKSHTSDNAAIKVKNAKNVTLTNNITQNCFFGIYLSGVTNTIIKNNQIEGNGKKETASGNGIHLWKCNKISIQSNTISMHRDGIYFEFVKNTEIVRNTSTKNVRYGLHFMFSDSCNYYNNIFNRNGAGVAVMYTKNVNMYDNNFEKNWGSASYGILLKDIKDSYINNNKFVENTVGILSEGSIRVKMENNLFERNGWAMKILGNCYENIVINNDFIGNTFDIATNSSENHNRIEKNYWSSYDGYDMNKDGIGDIPHYPVSLFSIVVQNSSPATILMHSFFIDILEIGEKVFPSLIPKKMFDSSPLMKPTR